MLKQIIAAQDSDPWITASAVFGLYPANAVGDDIALYADESRDKPLMRWKQPAPTTRAPFRQTALLPE